MNAKSEIQRPVDQRPFFISAQTPLNGWCPQHKSNIKSRNDLDVLAATPDFCAHLGGCRKNAVRRASPPAAPASRSWSTACSPTARSTTPTMPSTAGSRGSSAPTGPAQAQPTLRPPDYRDQTGRAAHCRQVSELQASATLPPSRPGRGRTSDQGIMSPLL
jgi:hypothetical protein